MSIVPTLLDVPRTAPIPIPSSSRAQEVLDSSEISGTPYSTSSTPSEYSSTSSRLSDNDSWVPEGKYVPLHRRTASHSSYASDSTLITSAPSSPQTTKKSSLPDPASESESKQQSESERSSPKSLVYSRESLLALAPSSLVLASIKPVVTPALIRIHSTILRPRGDGIARALEMARTPVNVHTSYALGRSPPKSSKRAKSASPPQSRPSKEPHVEMIQQVRQLPQRSRSRRRDRRRAGQVEDPGANGMSTVHTSTTGANLSKESPSRLHPLDLVHSWRAPQAVQA